MNINVTSLIKTDINIGDIYMILRYNMNIYTINSYCFRTITVYYRRLFQQEFSSEDFILNDGVAFQIENGTVILEKGKKIKNSTVIVFGNTYDIYENDVYDKIKKIISSREKYDSKEETEHKIDKLLKQCGN